MTKDEIKKRHKLWKRRLFLLTSHQWWKKVTKRGVRLPKHDSALPGYMWMQELWAGNDHRFFEQFRMRKAVFGRLISIIQNQYGFKPFEKVGVDESLGMFLYMLGHGLTFPIVTERFQRSGQTVSAHFHEMLRVVCRMGIDLIKPDDPSFSTIPEQLRNDARYFPYFSGCVGAVDGTHITLRVRGQNSKAWYDRKKVTSTNVLVVVDFNLCVTYAKIGLEGSMHDSRILFRALRENVNQPFPLPPQGKYYLADAGFPNIKGFLTPYKKVRYHLADFRQAGAIRNKDENFNYVHSSLRSMVERTFGIIKERFKILKHMNRFDLQTQMRIIWAAFALHNFLRKNDSDDLHLLDVPTDESNDDAVFINQVWVEPCREDAVFNDNLKNMIRESLDMRSL